MGCTTGLVSVKLSLLRFYQEDTVILDQTEGECCSSCNTEQEKDFNAKDVAILLPTAIKELEKMLPMLYLCYLRPLTITTLHSYHLNITIILD